MTVFAPLESHAGVAYGPGNLMPMHAPCPAEFIRSEGRFTGLTSHRFVLYSLQER